jgi:pimeloyl-ACP methyl ester carboxylesterase
VPIGTALVTAVVEAVARDLGMVLRLVRERHGVGGGGVALFGVSLGALLSSFAFMRDGIGERLLCALGHADLRRFASSFTPALGPLLVSPSAQLLAWLAGRWLGPQAQAGLAFLHALSELAEGGPTGALDPMFYAGRVWAGRSVRFLVGADDPVVRPDDARACARRFADGECYVVPGLAHGTSNTGPSFVEHVRTFVGTQLGDWRR